MPKLSLASMLGTAKPDTFQTDFVPLLDIDPKGKKGSKVSLLPHQVPHALVLANAIKHFRATADASDAGTGKTYVACAVARQLGLKMLIVCPKAVMTAWRQVAAEFGVTVADVLTYEKARNGNTRWLKLKVGETRHKANRVFYWAIDQSYLLVFDEAHNCKGQDSQNSRMMIAAKNQNLNAIACSATLATNPLEMKAVGYLLGLHKLVNFWSWCKDHGCVAGEFGGLVFDKTDLNNKKILLNIHKQLFPMRASRLRISDLGDAFPESLITAGAYDMGANKAKIQRAYDMMEAEIARLHEKTAGYMVNVLAAMMLARQQSEILKVPAFVELAQDAIEEGQSVAIFVNFTDTVHALCKRLGTDCVIIGGQSQQERDYNIHRFQTDDSRVIVCNIAAGGVGVSLHDLNGDYPRRSLISPNFSAIQMRQTLGRVWRSGGKTKSVQDIVFAAGTIEEQACKAVRVKLQNLATLNDGDFKAGIQI